MDVSQVVLDVTDPTTLPATALAAAVRSGQLSPVDVTRAYLDRIARADWQVGAFQVLRADEALAEAAALADRPDLDRLPLAGVPVAIKDTIAVAGCPTRVGSLATSNELANDDHEIVRRFRAAGAIVIGKTRVPELCIWAWTDSAFGITRNPRDLSLTPGGSSGGSAAAVAAGFTPIAHGSDGGGSIRIPAACCGLVGIKPGTGVVPGSATGNDWFGLSVNGPLATTVDDAALALAVMADDVSYAEPMDAPARLRVAISVRPPMPGGTMDEEYAAAARAAGAALASLGHDVIPADPPYDRNMLLTAAARSTAGIAQNAGGVDRRRLERRSRLSVRVGGFVRDRGWLRDEGHARWQEQAANFFTGYDVLITPALARRPIAAEGWAAKSILANAREASYAPFTQAWNVAGYPAVAMPFGNHSSGIPLSVQIVAPRGGERLILAVARLLEQNAN